MFLAIFLPILLANCQEWDWERTIEKVVEYQNQLRSVVATDGFQEITAANMNKLVHVPTLAYFAKSIARTHPRFTTHEHRTKGVIVHYSPGLVNDFRVITRDIWLEKYEQIFGIRGEWSPERYSPEMFDVAADAIQILWANATKIGCFGEFWKDEDEEEHTVLVCKYNAVAMVEKEMFKIGRKCSKCSRGHGMECEGDSGLCVERPVPDRNENERERYDNSDIFALNDDFDWVSLGRDVVKVHNRLRSELVFRGFRGETAANMNALEYDSELVDEAQEIIDLYRPESNTDKFRKQGVLVFYFPKFVQKPNYFVKKIWDKVIKYLRRLEKRQFNASEKLSRKSVRVAGDALQLIWAKSTRMGCAGEFVEEEEDDNKKSTYFVCKWDVPRTVGESVYENGEACEKCEDGREGCNPNGAGLCYEQYEEDEEDEDY